MSFPNILNAQARGCMGVKYSTLDRSPRVYGRF
jgi:hypothetical protein